MMKKLTQDQKDRLAKVAKDLMAIWEELPNHECEEGNDWYYRGGLVQLTCKGGDASGWVDLSWNQVITDIYAGEKLNHIAVPHTRISLRTPTKKRKNATKNAVRHSPHCTAHRT